MIFNVQSKSMIKGFFLLFHQYQKSFKIFFGKKKDSVATTKHLRIVNTPQFTNRSTTCIHLYLLLFKLILKLPRQHCMVINLLAFCKNLWKLRILSPWWQRESMSIIRGLQYQRLQVSYFMDFFFSPLSSIISVTICPHECGWINIVSDYWVTFNCHWDNCRSVKAWPYHRWQFLVKTNMARSASLTRSIFKTKVVIPWMFLTFYSCFSCKMQSIWFLFIAFIFFYGRRGKKNLEICILFFF
jgi:hypothetical protein